MNRYYDFRHDDSIYLPAEEIMPNNMGSFNVDNQMMPGNNSMNDSDMMPWSTMIPSDNMMPSDNGMNDGDMTPWSTINPSNNMMPDNQGVNNLFTPYEGLMHGNLFKNQYEPYKNYQPARLIPANEMEDALIKLDQYQFAMHELNLVLDVNPHNTIAMNQFIGFRRQYNQALNDFETKYGAINVSSPVLNSVPFGWVQEKWPWEGRK